MKSWTLVGLSLLVLSCGGGGGEECTPVCEEGVTECGDDGCGGTCGTCGAGSVCLSSKCMKCTPECTGRMCGPDGCGGQCGACSDGQVCEAYSYLCIDKPSNCTKVCETSGFECGPDGCGAECGQCSDSFCDPDSHMCFAGCLPQCDGRDCGDDGCGGVCGECSDDQLCSEGQCVAGNVLPDEDFYIVFGYKGRIPGVNDNEHDLHFVAPDGTNPLNPADPGPQALTEFSLGNAQDCRLILAEGPDGEPTEYGQCSCQFGCIVDRNLKWIAVSLKKPTAEGFTFQIGRFDSELSVAMVKGVTLEGVIDFKFAGNYLYYSKLASCQGPSCQYMISRIQLDPIGSVENLFVFPPEDDPDWPQHSNYKGHFTASFDGTTLVMWGTTIRSTRLYMWQDGLLTELDYICNLFMDGACMGAGSDYSDEDPVAISRDNSKVAAFTIAESDLKIRVYDTKTKTQRYQTLASVPSGAYLNSICSVLNNDPWRFKSVVGDPQFSADGSSIYFIASNDCGVLQGQNKPLTNLLYMDLASVGDGSAFEQTDFINITNNPKGDVVENLWIESFDLSPSGKVIVMSASPAYDDGVILPSTSDRARKDREIWVLGTNGAGKAQITDSLQFMAKAPMAIERSVIDGATR